MKTGRFELLKQEEKNSVIVREYILNDEDEGNTIVYTELLTQDEKVIDTFMTDQYGDSFSEAEYPGLLKEVQDFLFSHPLECNSCGFTTHDCMQIFDGGDSCVERSTSIHGEHDGQSGYC